MSDGDKFAEDVKKKLTGHDVRQFDGILRQLGGVIKSHQQVQQQRDYYIKKLEELSGKYNDLTRHLVCLIRTRGINGSVKISSEDFKSVSKDLEFNISRRGSDIVISVVEKKNG